MDYNNTQIGQFRFWCQKILPAVYDDSLSYYELLCKTVDKLNDVIEQSNNVSEAMQTLYDFVNNYFDNLDVQEEINKKLDYMAESGQLQAMVNEIFVTLETEMAGFTSVLENERYERMAQDNVLSARIDELTTLQDGSTTGDAELADIRTAFEGSTYDNAGDAVRAQAAHIGAGQLDILEGNTIFNKKYPQITQTVPSGSTQRYALLGTSSEISVSAGDKIYVLAKLGNLELNNEITGTADIGLRFDTRVNDTVVSGSNITKFADSHGNIAFAYSIPAGVNGNCKIGVSKSVRLSTSQESSTTFTFDVLSCCISTTPYYLLDGISVDSSSVGMEVINARTAYDGTEFSNLGDSIRTNERMQAASQLSIIDGDFLYTRKYGTLSDTVTSGNRHHYTMFDYIENANISSGEKLYVSLHADNPIYSVNVNQNASFGIILKLYDNESGDLISGSDKYVRTKGGKTEVEYDVPEFNNEAVKLGIGVDVIFPNTLSNNCKVSFDINELCISKSKYRLSKFVDIPPTTQFASMAVFPKFGVIGDSYVVGSLYNSSAVWTGNKTDQCWSHILARLLGTQATNYAASGVYTKTWLTNSNCLAALLADDAQDLYIMCLGINDMNHYGIAGMGTIDDIADYQSYSDYPDTFYGNYGKIIEQVAAHAPHASLIISTVQSGSATGLAFSEAIEEIADYYHIPCLIQRNYEFFTSDYYINGKFGGHPSACVYSGMAVNFKKMIEDAMTTNFDYFKDIFAYSEV